MKVINMRFAGIFVGLAMVLVLAESKPTTEASGDSKQRKRSTKGVRHVKSLAIGSIEGLTEAPATEKGLKTNTGEDIKTDPTTLMDVNAGSGVKVSAELQNTEGESKVSAKVENIEALSSNSVYTEVAKGKEVVKEADKGHGMTKVAVKGKTTTNGKPTRKHGTKHRKHRKRMTHSGRVKTRKAAMKSANTGKGVSVAANLINGPETTYRPIIITAVSKKSKKVHGAVKSKTKRKGLARIGTKVKSAAKEAATATKVKQSATMSEKSKPSLTEAAVKGNDHTEVAANEVFQSKAEIKEDVSAGNVVQELSQQSVTTDSTNIIDVTDRIAKDIVTKSMISAQVNRKESSGADTVPNDAINEVVKDSTNGKDVVKDADSIIDVKDATNVQDVLKDATNVNDVLKDATNVKDAAKDATNVNDIVKDAANVQDVVKEATNVNDAVKDAANIIDEKESTNAKDIVKDVIKIIDVVKEANDADVTKDAPNENDIRRNKNDAETVTKDATRADADTNATTCKNVVSKDPKNEGAVITGSANANAFTNDATSADKVDPDAKNGKIAKKDDTIDDNSTKDAIYNENVNMDRDASTKDRAILDGTTNDSAYSKNVIMTSTDQGIASKDDTGVNNIINDVLNDVIVPPATNNREDVQVVATDGSNIKTDESAQLDKTNVDDRIQNTANGNAKPETTSNMVVNNGAAKMTVGPTLSKTAGQLISQSTKALEVVTRPAILPGKVEEELHLPEDDRYVEPIEDRSAAKNELVAVTAGGANILHVTPSSAVLSEAVRETKITTLTVPETTTPVITSVVLQLAEPALAGEPGINSLQQSAPLDKTADKNSILPAESSPNLLAVAAVTAPTANTDKIMDPYKSTSSPTQTQELQPVVLSSDPPGPVQAKIP